MSLQKQKLTTLYIVSIVAVCILSPLFVISTFEAGVIKLRMPASYYVDLSVSEHKGCYGIWYFWIWPSKNINEPPQRVLKLAIADSNGESVPIRTVEYGGEPNITTNCLWNTGREIGSITIRAPQRFSVTCSEKCVVVLVPCTAYVRDLYGWDRFWGAFDDFNFAQKP